MIPHDILNQILDNPPHDEDVTWDGDFIRIHSGFGSAKFRRHTYTRIDINLSQGVVYFFTNSALVLKLALEVKLHTITTVGAEPETEEESGEAE